MPAILLIIATATVAAVLFDKRIHETLPVSTFIVTLGVYALALILPINAAVWICAVLVTVAVITAVVLCLINNVSGRIGSCMKDDVSPLAILMISCLTFCILMSHHHAFFYDDLSYWALYTKNIFEIGKLPHLYENCSVYYKDYTPIIQIVQYLAMFGQKTFDESGMFQTNVCLIYIFTLPLLNPLCNRKSGRLIGILATVFYVIFPHILTSQFYYRLGVDLLLALVFGYALYCIWMPDNMEYGSDGSDAPNSLGLTNIFRITAIILSLAFLALIKTSGIVLCIFAIIFFVIRELSAASDPKKSIWFKTGAITIFTLGSYYSWKLFLRFSWNRGYLSDRVSDAGGGALHFPEYTLQVVKNYIIHFFTYPLTRNRIGVTAFVLVVFICLVYRFASKQGYDQRSQKQLLICSLAGLLLFCLAHLSMYLFVFDDWEAYGLLEFDRYITQYLGGIFFVYVCLLLNVPDTRGQSREGAGKNSLPGEVILTCISLAVFIILLPYADIRQYLIPSNYDAMYKDSYQDTVLSVEAEWMRAGLAEMNLPHDGSAKLTVVADEWDESTQFLEYTAVPQPFNRMVNVPAVEPGELAGFIMDFVDEYVYVAENAKGSYQGDWQETAQITSDGMELEPGAVYYVDRSNDDKTLVRIN